MDSKRLAHLLEHPSELPDVAFKTLATDKTQVILVKKGVAGYYPYQRYGTEQQALETCQYGNEKIGVTEEEAEALSILSMRRN